MLFASWLVFASALMAVEPEPARVILAADRPALAAGESVGVEITVSIPRSWQLQGEADWTVALDELPLSSVAAAEAQFDQERWRWYQRFQLRPDEAGALRLAGIEVLARDADGQLQQLRSEDLLIEVLPAGAMSSLGLPAAPEQPWTLPAAPSPWWMLGLGLLLLALLGGWLWWRRRPLAPLALPPLPRCRQRLAQLDGLASADQAHGLSLALREYLGAVLGFAGANATLHECLQHLQSRQEAAGDFSTALAILEEIEGSRWAPQGAAALPVQVLIQRSQNWLDQQERLLQQLQMELQQSSQRSPSASGKSAP
ncbi:MAG: hypothetical protein EA402_06970 [Planctomycetota bacterium]|nr:MAG: hypothetical protein EA402_06970 [Planctomycetota bacterium]